MIEGRLDAEYYQPEYVKLASYLDATDTFRLSSVCRVSRAKTDPSRSPDTIFRYIEIENVDTDTGEVTYQTILGRDAPSRARRAVRANNVIISMVRPGRGIVGIIEKDLDGCVCSTGFCVLVPQGLDSNFLFGLLKTDLAKKQLMRKTTASMYPTVSEKDVLGIRMPSRILRPSFVQSASKQVQEAKELFQSAKTRLQQALAEVEEGLKKA
jgi:type I restriction enzyme S subunit